MRFLACLELYKQGLVDLEQASTFGELLVRPLAPGERGRRRPHPRGRVGRRRHTGRRHRAGAARRARRGRRDVKHRTAQRAIEAVVMASPEPVAPDLLAQLVEIPTAEVEEICDAARIGVRARRPWVRARPRRRRIPLPDASRSRAVRRALRARRPARASVARGARDARRSSPTSSRSVARNCPAIRGVNVDATLRTLVQRGYVEEVDHESTPGNPARFGTTSRFLERLGVNALVGSSRAG